MIVNFGFKNYFSFKEGADITFALDKNPAESIPNKDGVSYVLGIKGANSSGKTNIIRALGFISDFVKDSHEFKNDKLIEVDTFLMNEEDSEFYLDFYVNDYLYSYYISLNEEKVSEEILTRKLKREVPVFHRLGNTIKDCLSELDEIKKIKLKSNASMLSMLNSIEFNMDMRPLKDAFGFFKNIAANVDYSGLREAPISYGYHEICAAYKKVGDGSLDFVKKIIKLSDSSIIDIEIKERLDQDTGKSIYLPYFVHKYGNEEKRIPIFDESSGTKILFRTMCLYWIVLEHGGVMAIDEFDLHLHAMILPHIIELFENTESNPKNAQFIFTAHNTEIMDYLGKYRTILVNKNNLESYCYRLDEMPEGLIPNSHLRGDRKISSLYLKKKLGGVPEL